MKKIRMIVLGLGFWGKCWVEEVSKCEELELVGVADQSGDARQWAIKERGLPAAIVHEDYKEALSKCDADAVGIVLRPEMHLPAIEAAARARLHILCEKPLAESMASAGKIGAILSRHPDQVFMVDQTRRWRDHVLTLKEEIAVGRIGRVGLVNIVHLQSVDMGGYRAAFSFPVLDDMAIHHFDMVRYIVGGKARSVFARSFNPSWSWYETKPVSQAMIEMDNGVMVNYLGSWVSMGKITEWEGEVMVMGSGGALEARDEDTILYYPPSHDHDCPTHKQVSAQKVEPHRHQFHEIAFGLREFVRCIRTGSEPQTNYEDNLQSFAMVCAAAESCRTGQVVELSRLLET